VRCLDATANYFVSKVQGEVIAQFHAVAVKLYGSMQNCVWSTRTNSLSEKIMSMLLALLFTCLNFIGLGEFELSVYGSCFCLRSLVSLLPGSSSYFFRALHNI
jgi:hypothetical protein